MTSPRWSPDGRRLLAIAVQPAAQHQSLMLFSFRKHGWEKLVSGPGFGWPAWSRASDYIYAQEGNVLVRIDILTRKTEQIASMDGVSSTAFLLDRWGVGWVGFTQEGGPITTLDKGITEIYALDLEYK